jgi:hypothetical protein
MGLVALLKDKENWVKPKRTTEIAFKKRMPREGLPVCSIRLPTRQLPRQGLPFVNG